ncbi:hypothetical protein BGZ95_003434 [Linnemannia exigua]|uniref:Exosome complex protein n=1 Tax=Linnemannia exigua TaxID=604196 RepID=A0AAD4D4N8_9FUNG|nr:hypothetical protein BGZ95_003434 [Linnemannia exigua]
MYIFEALCIPLAASHSTSTNDAYRTRQTGRQQDSIATSSISLLPSKPQKMPPKIQEPLSQTLPANHRNATNAMLASLAELETMLAPLFATSSALSETVAKLDTEKRCQLELLLAYALNTLAFINLKTNGTAPTSHPVMHELKRIKGYTEKLRQVTQGAPVNTMEVDKDAAARFIKGALAANLVADRKQAEEEEKEQHQPQGTHMRFEDTAASSSVAAEERTTTREESTSASASQKKRAMDPFQGYDNKHKKSKPT